ncbi:MAG: 16S rRNA (cytosine(1402)-N(4))-methyltransferase RsmH [Calditrichaeota bacterium]|nr:16S rRNA (cytosine(1402)-N(4))-methyltransferase RsmH [Calditrichota bacterium]
MTRFFHRPVLVREAADLLLHDSAGTYVDATIGGGGHAQEILRHLTTGRLIGLDCDPDAIGWCREHLPREVLLLEARFSQMLEVVAPLAPSGIQGVLFDLGVSSHQLDCPQRGFSYQQDGPLDLRMDPTISRTAADIVNELPQRELSRLISTFGEEPQASRIAKAIVHAREQAPICTTVQLAGIISKSVPAAGVKALARTFQALRIAVNNELDELAMGLDNAWRLLASGGRLVVLTYHSLEAKIVKSFFAGKIRGCVCPPELPICRCGRQSQAIALTRKAISPSPDEISVNPRARSARLRGLKKL